MSESPEMLEIRAFHRALRGWKLGETARYPRGMLRRNLHSLIVTQGYGLTDISLMLGISRERVRQLANVCGITKRNAMGGRGERGGSLPRRWNDRRGRFEPAPMMVWRKRDAKVRRRARRIGRHDRSEARRVKMVEAIRQFAATHGRAPFAGELAWVLMGIAGSPPRSGSNLRSWLTGGQSNARKGTRIIHNCYAEAGQSVPGLGSGNGRKMRAQPRFDRPVPNP